MNKKLDILSWTITSFEKKKGQETACLATSQRFWPSVHMLVMTGAAPSLAPSVAWLSTKTGLCTSKKHMGWDRLGISVLLVSAVCLS